MSTPHDQQRRKLSSLLAVSLRIPMRRLSRAVPGWFRAAPAWLISVFLHLIAVFIMAVLVVRQQPEKSAAVIDANFSTQLRDDVISAFPHLDRAGILRAVNSLRC